VCCTVIRIETSLSKDKTPGSTSKIGIEFRLNGDDVIVSLQPEVLLRNQA